MSSGAASGAAAQLCLAGTANMCAACVTNPVDVVKTRMQMTGLADSRTPFRSTLHCARSVVGSEGPRALMKGLSASLLREGSYSGMRMGLYEPCKELLGATDPKTTPLLTKIAAGALTGATGSALANPMDLVKVRMQTHAGVPGGAASPSVAGVFRDVATERGIPGLWRGCGPTVQRAAILTATQMPAYDHCKHLAMDHYGVADGPLLHFASCMFAGVCAALTTSPVDLAKTRVMNESNVTVQLGGVKLRTVATLAHIARTEGPLACYKGFTTQWLRIGPHTCISLMVFEKLRQLAGMRYL